MKKLLFLLLIYFITPIHPFAQSNSDGDSAQYYLTEIKTQLPKADSTQLNIAKMAIDFSIKAKNDSLLMMAWYYSGVLYYYSGQYQVSNYDYEKALNIARKNNFHQIAYRLLNNRGINFDLMDDAENSLKSYQSAMEILKENNHQKGIAQVNINLGRLFRITRDFEKSEHALYEALEYFIQTQDTFYIGLSYQNLASLYVDQKLNEQKVNEFFSKALEQYQSIQYDYGIVELYHNWADYYRKEVQDYGTAQSYFKKALEISKKNQTHPNNTSLSLALAKMAMEEKNWDKARFYALLSLKQAKQQNKTSSQILALKTLVPLYIHLHQNDSANILLNKYLLLNDSLYNAEKLQSFNELSVIYDLDRKNQILKEQEYQILEYNIQKNWLITCLILALIIIGIISFFYRYRNQKLRQQYLLNKELFKQEKSENSKRKRGTEPKQVEELANNIGIQSHFEPELFERINTIVLQQKLYTDNQLKVSYLADLLHTNQKYISIAINDQTGMNFSLYLNKLRVKEAQCLIEKNGELGLSLEQVMSRAGFKSRTTFTDSFKRFTGMTPGQYQKYAHEYK